MTDRLAWTTGPAKWAAVAVLGCCSIAGLYWSLNAQARRDALTQHRGDTSLTLDLNAATSAQLELLPGIGPSRAEAIVADRETNGPFASLTDLDRVPGIGPRTIADLEPYLDVVPPTADRYDRTLSGGP